jgi:hypothetical protein
MTTEEAIALANRVKPLRRASLDKLEAGTTAGQLTARVDALNKRWSGMSSTITDMQKQLDRARAGVALCADVMKITINTETMQ